MAAAALPLVLPGVFVLDVSDDLGFADRLFTFHGRSGPGSASALCPSREAPDDAAAVALMVDDLGSLYLGGVSAVTLARAGHPPSSARLVHPWTHRSIRRSHPG
jgi:hypothetical protein